jgi:hypothetical protein
VKVHYTAIPIIIEGHETAFEPVYFWKTLERPETDPQLLWEWQYLCFLWRCIFEKESISKGP